MVSPDVPQVEDGWRDQLSNDKVRIIAKFPEIPVGGRLSLFMNEWKKITDDKWVLEIIQKGYKLEFLKKPAFGGIKHTRVPPDQIELISLEIESLLKKNAIEKVSTKNAKAGFYSTLFLVAKKSGEMRPVINLRPLNKYLRKLHFKMDTLCKVLDLVQTGDWGLTLDLKDAYFHIKVFKKHRKYLRFCFQNQVYQFRALCFGPTVSPRVFTKVVAVVTAHLHRQNIRLASYLDDWLAVNQLRRMLLQNRDVILNLLFHLGFIVNKDKSNLVPTQKLTYIGGLFHLNTGLVYPTETRVKNLKKAIKMILKGHRTARQFLVLLGQIASCLQLIPNARLFMRPIQLHLLEHWSPVRMDMSVKIPLTPQLGLHLNWWLQDQNILKGYCFQPRSYLVTLTTDASLWGWGAHLNGYLVQGRWSKLQSLRHVNLLELEAVFLAVKHFLPFLKNQNVLIRTDNTTVMHYINKQGGTRSRPLCHMSWDLWNLVLKNNMQIKAAHIMGKRNYLADLLSRKEIRSGEWVLKSSVVNSLFALWGQPMIDLFATQENKKAMLFCSWIPSQHAFALDALSVAWENMYAYAFPPIQLIHRVLCHMKQYQCTVILIAPCWPRQQWFPILLSLLIAKPVRLPCSPDLLSQSQGVVLHPEPETLNLMAWMLSTDTCQQRAFLQKQDSCCPHHGGRVQRETTTVSSDNLVVGVIHKKLIRCRHLS